MWREGRYWTKLENGRIRCEVCPRFCTLKNGQAGLCANRIAYNDKIIVVSDEMVSGICADPIEKKPLYHFLPGTPVLSFGTIGCNLTCKFCQNWEISKSQKNHISKILEKIQQEQDVSRSRFSQNWDISKSREFDKLAHTASPEAIAAAAAKTGCRSVAFTYNDPVIFLEYAVDVAAACRARGLKTVAVSAGYISAEPRAEFFAAMDAANIDLKAFTEDFYHELCTAGLAPVLDTLKYLKHETDVWFELTDLIIPGANDSDRELDEMTRWVVENLGPDVPMHFSAFHPDWKMRDVPATPPRTLSRAREIAMRNGVRYAYVGNVHDPAADSTYCHACGEMVIGRDWYELSTWNLTADGHCGSCGTACAGVFDGPPGDWGRKRAPVRLSGA